MAPSPDVKLYPHAPSALLPLLSSHLPYSLAVYGTIVSAPSTRDPLLRAEVPHAQDGNRGIGVQEGEEEMVVWATFAPDAIPLSLFLGGGMPERGKGGVSSSNGRMRNVEGRGGDEERIAREVVGGVGGVWTVIVPYAGVESHQTRMYCSAEHPSYANTYEDARGSTRAGVRGIEGDGDDQYRTSNLDGLYRQATAQVISTYQTYTTQVDPDFKIAGCVHTLWSRAVEDAWGVKWEDRRGYCGVWVKWMPPTGRTRMGGQEEGGVDGGGAGVVGEDVGEGEEQEKQVEVEGGGRGYVVRRGREGDVGSFIRHTDIKRTAAYYRSRLPFSSILVLSSSPPRNPGRLSPFASHASAIPAEPLPARTQATPVASRSTPHLLPPESQDPVKAATSTSPRPDTPPREDKAERGEVAAQILTHADGTLGSLYTFEAFRKRGLGKRLVREHMASGRGVVRVGIEMSQGGGGGADGWGSRARQGVLGTGGGEDIGERARKSEFTELAEPAELGKAAGPNSAIIAPVVTDITTGEGRSNGVYPDDQESRFPHDAAQGAQTGEWSRADVLGSDPKGAKEQAGGWAWTHIFHGNTASEAVFDSLGFERMWDVAWVYRA